MKNRMGMLLAGLLVMAHAGSAQTKTSFGIRAGVNFQNLNGEAALTGNDLDNKLKTGFHVGVDVDIPIAESFYVRPGVLFSTKGAKMDDEDDTKINLSYIEVPISFVFKPTLGTGKLVLGIGPYVAYAIDGKIKDDEGDSDIEFENEITTGQWFSATRYYKGLDAGGNIFFGYEFNQHLSAQLNAQLGLVSINSRVEGVDEEDIGKTKNTGFGISVGYRF